MKLTPLLLAALAASCGLASGAAQADATSWDPSIGFSGFGAVGYVQTSTDTGLSAGPAQSGGASKKGTAGVDSAAQLADLPDTLPARDVFHTKVAGQSTAQVKAGWSRRVFAGKATPPTELGSSADVEKFVAANPDAIGCIEKSALDSTVKVVFSAD